AQIHHTEAIAYLNQSEGMIDGLGDPESVCGQGKPLCECTTFGVAEAQPSQGVCRDAAISAKAFSEQLSLESRHIPLQTLDGPWIVSSVVIDLTQGEIGPGLEADITERCSHGQGALAVIDGALNITRPPERGAHLGVDPPESQWIAQRLGQSLGV